MSQSIVRCMQDMAAQHIEQLANVCVYLISSAVRQQALQVRTSRLHSTLPYLCM